jgi:hypothetical protein
VKYQFFARILALCRGRIITNPIRQLYSLSYCAYSCLIGLVIIWSRLRAMNLAKPLIGSKIAFSIITHLCSEMAVFGRKSTFRQAWSIQYSRTKLAIRFYLRNRTTAQTEYLMGSTVNNLSEFWVCKLSFLNSSPAIMPLAASYFGGIFFRGHNSLKNRTYCPLFSHDSTSFKKMCLLIKLKEVKVALYGPHLHCEPGH